MTSAERVLSTAVHVCTDNAGSFVCVLLFTLDKERKRKEMKKEQGRHRLR